MLLYIMSVSSNVLSGNNDKQTTGEVFVAQIL